MPISRNFDGTSAMPDFKPSQGMSDRVYDALCKLVYTHSRIYLTQEKKNFLSSRLERHRRDLQAVDWEIYLGKLMNATDAFEIEKMIDWVATNHTYFFREPSHFDRLSHDLLSSLIQSHPQSKSQLKCWSVAASSGEEAFSLAITLAEYARQNGPLEWSVHATDISRRVLEKANACIYNQDALNLPSVDLLARYFRRGTGPYEGQCKVKDSLIQHVQFAQANVFQNNLPVPERLNLIFCRNVLIYFDAPSRQQLISRLEKMLEPGGLLLVGHTESLFNMRHKLQALGGGIFRRSH
jgi:chemotaxis protein methyltransferase CheR